MNTSFLKVEAALCEAQWVAPYVKNEILKVDWSTIGEADVANYLNGCISSLNSLVSQVIGKSDRFRKAFLELIEHFSKPLALEAAVLQDESITVLDSLFAVAGIPSNDGRFDLQRLYFSLNLQALVQATRLERPLFETEREEQLNAAYMLAAPWNLIGECNRALEMIVRPLSLACDTVHVPIAEFLAVLRYKMGRFRGVVECEYLKLLAELLAANGRYLHAISVGRFRFDSQTGTPSMKPFSTAMSYALTQFAKAIPEPILDQQQVDATTRLEAELTLSIIKTMVTSSRVLLSAPDNEAISSFLTPTEILDAVAGFCLGNEFDFSHFEILIAICPEESLFIIIRDWIETLEEREQKLPLLSAIIETIPEGETGVHRALDWWQVPHAAGRCIVLAVLVETLFNEWDFFDVVGFLVRCFHLNGDGAGELGQCLSATKHAHTRNAAKKLLLKVALEGIRENVEVRPMLEVWFGINGPDDYTSGWFVEACRFAMSTVSSKVGVNNIDAWILVLLAYSHVASQQNHTAQIILASSIGCEYFEWDRVRESMQVLYQSDPALFSFLATCVTVLSASNIEYAGLAMRLLEISNGLPDIEKSDPDHIAKIICAKIDRELQAGNFDCFGSATDLTLVLANRELHDQCFRVGDAVLSLIASHHPDLQDDVFAAMARIRLLAIMSSPCLSRGKYEYLLNLTRPCFGKDCQPHPDSLEVILPEIPSEMPFSSGLLSDISHASKTLVLAKLQALYALKRTDELSRCIRFSYTRERWQLAVGVGAPDVLIAAEVARVVCNWDTEYVQTLYSYSLAALASIEETLNDVVRYEMSRLLEGVRHAIVQLGTSISAALTQAEGAYHRVSHLLVEANLANQKLQFRCQVAKEHVQLADIGFEYGYALEQGLTPGAKLTSLDSEFALISFRKSKLKNLSVHPSSIAWEGSRISAIGKRFGELEDSLNCSETDVAAAIGAGTLLRAAFSLDGRLVWTVLRAEEGNLRVVAQDSGHGRSDDRDTVRRLLDKHQSKIDGIWDAIADRKATKELREASPLTSVDTISSYQEHLKRVVSLYADGKPIKVVAKLIATPLLVLKNLHQHVIEEFGDPLDWHRQPPNIETWVTWWRDVFLNYFPSINESSSVRKLLDDETQQLLNGLQLVIPTDQIAAAIDGAQELIVWPDDELLGVPFAFLQCRTTEKLGSFLFECVPHIRTVVSPLCDLAMRNRDSRGLGEGRPLILSAAYLSTAEELPVATFVQNALASVAAKCSNQFDWKMAHGERCRSDVLSKEIFDCAGNRIALLIVCGHGAQNPQGVRMNDGTWDGHAIYRNIDGNTFAARTADLSQIEFLIQISCSIGRIRQEGFQDVAGFCANLIHQGICSVVAGRWTLHATEGIALAMTISDRYLSSYADTIQDGPRWKSKIRSGAVARTRREWADAYRQGNDNSALQFGLNTIANLDLYGLG